jgi:hypothetical protein
MLTLFRHHSRNERTRLRQRTFDGLVEQQRAAVPEILLDELTRSSSWLWQVMRHAQHKQYVKGLRLEWQHLRRCLDERRVPHPLRSNSESVDAEIGTYVNRPWHWR